MIVEKMIESFLATMMSWMSAFEVVQLPTQFIETLSTITAYGVWIVGSDVLALFTASIVAIWSGKLVVGLVVWLYEHIPFIS